jgi:hypothetical protein
MEPFLALLVSADSGALTVTQKILEEYGVSVKVALHWRLRHPAAGYNTADWVSAA